MAKDKFFTVIDKAGIPHWRYEGIDGNLLTALKDGERMRVSLTDAQEVRDTSPHRHTTDAGRERLQQYDAYLDGQFNRPGYRVIVDQEARDGHTAKQHAYDAYERELVNAFRHVRDDNATGAGSPARAFGKPAPEGSVCMTNSKEPGHIRNGVCVPDSSSEESDPKEGLSDGARAMRDEARRQQAYDAYRYDLENAWKQK